MTSDSDLAYLCRKLRERGATVCVVGEPKTPEALRQASDRFFEWTPAAEAATPPTGPVRKPDSPRQELVKPLPKRRPRMIVEAVSLLAASTPDGRVQLSPLGNYLKHTDPAFSPKTYGHAGLLDMLKTYDLPETRLEPNGHWTVALVAVSTEVPA